MRRSLTALRNVEDARGVAERSLPRVLFDFIDGAADDEVTLRENRRAFERVTFRPRAATVVDRPELKTRLLGVDLALPVVLAPCGGVRLVWPDGDRELVKAAGAIGTVPVMSTALGTEVEDVMAAASGPVWFQLYFRGGRSGAEALVDRVQRAGFGALFVTVDSAARGSHERLQRHGVPFPLKASARTATKLAPQLVRRPRWVVGYLRDGMPTSFESNLDPVATEVSGSAHRVLPGEVPDVASNAPTWKDFDWIRPMWKGPLVVKGILTSEDALRAIDVGADAIVVSNHGGRQLDGTPATLRVLPEIRAAVDGRVAVILDSGVRRGTDVIKAMALGADAAMIGRPYLYGLAAGGGGGVTRVLDIFRSDLVRTLRSLGYESVASLSAEAVDASRLHG